MCHRLRLLCSLRAHSLNLGTVKGTRYKPHHDAPQRHTSLCALRGTHTHTQVKRPTAPAASRTERSCYTLGHSGSQSGADKSSTYRVTAHKQITERPGPGMPHETCVHSASRLLVHQQQPLLPACILRVTSRHMPVLTRWKTIQQPGGGRCCVVAATRDGGAQHTMPDLGLVLGLGSRRNTQGP